jgi:sigma 54 modulation/S30EA-like ribosomal protein
MVDIRLTFRGLDASAALGDYVRFRTLDLALDHSAVTRVDVVIDQGVEHWPGRGRYRASVRAVAGHLVVADGLAQTFGHESPSAAIDAAFARMHRLMNEHVRGDSATWVRTGVTTRMPRVGGRQGRAHQR